MCVCVPALASTLWTCFSFGGMVSEWKRCSSGDRAVCVECDHTTHGCTRGPTVSYHIMIYDTCISSPRHTHANNAPNQYTKTTQTPNNSHTLPPARTLYPLNPPTHTRLPYFLLRDTKPKKCICQTPIHFTTPRQMHSAITY